MNKLISLKRAAFVAVALGSIGTLTAFADSTDTTPSTTTTGTGAYGGGWHHHHHHRYGALNPTERAELKGDFQKVFAANPSLKTQEESLHQQFKALKSQTTPATQAQWDALKQQKEALHTQIRAAVEGVDSGAAALFQKIDAAKGQQHQPAN